MLASSNRASYASPHTSAGARKDDGQDARRAPVPAEDPAQNGVTARPPAVGVPQPRRTAAEQAVSAAVLAARIDLTAEEQALIERHTLEGLDSALAEAQSAFTVARPAERPDAQRQYLLLLNLVGKLAPSPPPVPKDVVARQQEYLQAAPDEQRRLAALPEPERAAKLAEFKQRFFERKTSQTGH